MPSVQWAGVTHCMLLCGCCGKFLEYIPYNLLPEIRVIANAVVSMATIEEIEASKEVVGFVISTDYNRSRLNYLKILKHFYDADNK